MLERDYISKLKVFLRKTGNAFLYWSGIYYVLYRIYKRPGIYIVYYHRVVDGKKDRIISKISVDKRSLEKQIEYYTANFCVITMDDAVKLLESQNQLDQRYMVITFDDGYKDNLIYGVPIFKKYHVKPIIYAAAQNIDAQVPLWPDVIRNIVYHCPLSKAVIHIKGLHFNRKIKTISPKIQLVEQLVRHMKEYNERDKERILSYLMKELNNQGNGYAPMLLTWEDIINRLGGAVDIGSHTLHHPILKNLDRNDIRCELYESKLLLEERISRSVCHFAYPNGRKIDYDDTAMELAKCYYKSAVTTMEGINYPGEDLYQLKRIGIFYDMNMVDIKVRFLLLDMRRFLAEWGKK